jgi:hypothetical protein
MRATSCCATRTRGAGRSPTQNSRDAIEVSLAFQRSRRQRPLEIGTQFDQMPAQAVLHARAFGDEIVAVVSE